VATSDARDLLTLMTSVNFPSLGNGQLIEILQSIPEERRSAEVWKQLAEFKLNEARYEQALGFVNKGLKTSPSTDVTVKLQLMRVELLLRLNKLQDAQVFVHQFSNADLDDAQWLELAELFAEFGMHDQTDLLFERVRKRSKPTGLALVQLIERQAECHPRGFARWVLLLEAASAFPANSPHREYFLDRVLKELEVRGDGSDLEQLIKGVKSESMRVRLRLRQAEVLEDTKQIAEIVMDLIESNQLPPDRYFWALRILEDAGRSDDVVRLVETQLKKGQRPDWEVILLLRSAYQHLGRESEARRVASQVPYHRNGQPQVQQPGGGFF
jgi:tetratricopeptide (TPR) repeat protein